MLLRRNLSPKPFSLLHSITAVPFSTSTSAVDFLHSYTVTPPIQDWPHHLHPKLLISLITREPKLDLSLQIFHHASKYHPGFHHNYHTYHAIIRRLLRSRTFHLVDPSSPTSAAPISDAAKTSSSP
ncbi:hypothetical protein RchiOBHm_Chr1g0340441 [Rosa chinensis]|uniref:Uncharacterized protein n=1 Tax=Rosa chinensis TaxID=74649 RepID=A0A2P6SDG5_ROSCH|nr:pentatricopeptide repeat-containing protein At5g16420, mitochondrial [Rosa chinensis]PRQ56723.1 hypothetical protein RchiOBHm_Chr1g0340441 [Rosa chinensis]